MLLIFIVVLSLPSIVFGEPKVRSFKKLDLSKFSVGPESVAFDAYGGGPYASLADGRIVKYEHRSKSFQEFSFTQPNRSRSQCDGKDIRELWPICGRPLGLDFYHSKNQLYIADRFLGLLVAGPKRGVARQLATSANGVPFQFTNGLGVDQSTGDVYFTDMTNKLLQSPNNTKSGRLLKYEQKTGKVSVILSGIGNANGVAVSTDSSFLLLVEASEKRVLKVCLNGSKAFTSKVVFSYDGRPDNIKKVPSKDHFWVAFNFNEPNKPSLVPSRAIKINGDGKKLEEFNPGPYYNTTTITELNMRGSGFYIGSIEAGYVGAFSTK